MAWEPALDENSLNLWSLVTLVYNSKLPGHDPIMFSSHDPYIIGAITSLEIFINVSKLAHEVWTRPTGYYLDDHWLKSVPGASISLD